MTKTLPAWTLIALTAFLWLAGPAAAEDKGVKERDVYVGTTHEGILMETDPVTGDEIIQISPQPAPPSPEDNRTLYPSVIQPEIRYKTGK